MQTNLIEEGPIYKFVLPVSLTLVVTHRHSTENVSKSVEDKI